MTATTRDLDIQTVTIKPTEMERVRLGRFSKNDPDPMFQVIYHEQDKENPNVVSYHDEPIYEEDGSHYVLYRLFQSYSQQTHTLTVRFATASDRALSQPVR